MKSLHRLKVLQVASLILGMSGWFTVGNVRAASGVWTGAGDGTTWNSSSNWTALPGSASGTTNSDTATFNTGSGTIVIPANYNVKGISFDTSAGAFTIGSGSFPFVLTSGGTIQILSTFTGSGIAETINAPLTLEGNYTLSNNAANSTDLLDFGGGISTAVTGTLTLGGTNTGNNTISGAIANGAGTLALTKSGAGTWVLSGANTYTGATTIAAGTLTLASGGSMAATAGANLTVDLGATFNINGNVAWYNTSNLSGTVNFNSGTWTQLSTSNPIISLNSGAVFTEANGATFSGSVNLATVNTYNGGGGEFIIDSANPNGTGSIKPAINGSVLDNTNASGSNTGNFSSNYTLGLAGGTFTLEGVASGSTTETLGAFSFTTQGAVSSIVINPNGGSGTTLAVGTFGRTNVGSLLDLTLPTGATFSTTSNLATAIAGYGGILPYVIVNGTNFGTESGSDIVANTTYNVQTSSTYNSGTTSPVEINSSSPSTITVGGNLTTDSLLDNDSSAHTISLNNYSMRFGSYSGTNPSIGAIFTTAGAGALTIGSLVNDGTVSSGGGAATTGELLLINDSTSANVMNSALTNGLGSIYATTVSVLGSGTWVFAGTNTYTGSTIVDGDLQLTGSFGTTGGTPTGTAITVYSGGTLNETSAGVIQGSSSVTVGDSGGLGGTVILAGNNTYTGATTVNSGTLDISSATALGTGTLVFAAPLSGTTNQTIDNTSGAALTLTNNNAQTWGAGFTFTGSNSLNLGTGAVSLGITTSAATRTITVSNNTLTVGGSITNGTGATAAGSITLAGTGTLLLTGANSYTGKTTVSAGTLEFGNEDALYDDATASWTVGNIIVQSGATLALGVGTGDFTASDVSTLLALGTTAGGFESGSKIGFDTSGGSFTYSSTIANPNSGSNVLGLVKLGANTLTLSGANTYTGGTAINAGLLSVTNATGSGTGTGAVSVNATSNSAYGSLGGGNSSTLTTLGTGAHTGTFQNYTSGAGAITGAVTVNQYAHLAPGVGGVGTLTVGSLMLNSGAMLDYEFGASSNDFTFVLTSGGLTLNGGSFNLYQAGTTNAFAAAGVYNLLSYVGTLNGSISNLSVADEEAGYSYTFVNDTADGLVQLDITSAVPEPQVWVLLLGGLAFLIVWQRRQRANGTSLV